MKNADSFTSDRVKHIADAFVEHVNLDDPALKQQARGLTTADKNHRTADVVSEFILDLIPFRSAINNFIKGNVGDGLLDLGLDIFGFLTAGAATAGKVVKIAGTAVSAASKVARAAKAIGMATFSTLNPLGGLGDLSVGGAKFIGKGFGKATEWVNTLRGATGSYDLLKAASKQYDAAAIGTIKLAEHNTEAVAVLKDGKWYNYDVAKSKPYGGPLKDFQPSTLTAAGEIKAATPVDANSWLTSWFSSSAPNPHYVRDFEASRINALQTDRAGYNRGYGSPTPPSVDGYSPSLSISEIKQLSLTADRSAEGIGSLARRIEDLEDLPNRFFTKADNLKLTDNTNFNSGYHKGKPESVSGYTPDKKVAELQELALQPSRSSAEIGFLFRQIEKKTVAFNIELARKFGAEMGAAGGAVVHIPQGFYLSQVQPISGGQCAVLAQLMAYSKQEGKSSTLIDNLGTAMAFPDHVSTQAFRKGLQRFHTSLRTNFHGGQATRDLPFTNIISELSSTQTSKSLLISNDGHAISAGVTVNGSDKTWFYYDPNLGLATFTSEAAMRNGIQRAMSEGSTSHLFKPHADTLKYKVSDFNEVALMTTVGEIRGPYGLIAQPIVIPKPQLTSAVATP